MTRVSILMVVVVFCGGIGFDCADAKMPRKRRCDVAQEKPGNLNTGGGNAIVFGLCSVINDAPTGEEVSRAQFWNTYNCGYQAYREGKAFGANPFSQ